MTRNELRRGVFVGLGLLALATRPAESLEGRYLGSLQRSEGLLEDWNMRHLIDIGGTRVLPANQSLGVRMSLQYQSRPGQPESDLLRGRFTGDLRGSIWRLNAQLVPWQRTTAGRAEPGRIPQIPVQSPREQDLQLGFNLAPRRGPNLALNFGRQNRDTFGARSWTDNRRAQLSYTRGGVGSEVAYRRVATGSVDPAAAPSVTDEWRGALNGARAWKSVSVQGAYDALFSNYASRERRRDLRTQTLNLGATWNPHRMVSLGATGFDRWGSVFDNAPAGGRDVSEQTLNTSAEFRPGGGLRFEALRETRRRLAPAGRVVTDYLQFEGMLRRDLRRGLAFQSGYLGSVNLRREAGDIPNNTAYGLVDGRLRDGIEARAELRAARSGGGVSTGTQWQRVLQLRTRPTRSARFDVTWRKDRLPELFGVGQEDRQWELTAGYEVRPGTNLVGSWRALDGAGRVQRAERYGSFGCSWRFSDRSTLGFNWSRRTSWLPFETSDNAAGADVAFWLPAELRFNGSWRRVTQRVVRPEAGRPEVLVAVFTRHLTYAVALEKSF